MIFSLMDEIWERKYTFIGTFFLVFLFSYLCLVAIDFVPEPITSESEKETEESNVEESSVARTEQNNFQLLVGTVNGPVLPNSIYIEKLDRTIKVLNPDSRSIADLDTALLSGVVRHPDSSDLSEDGTVFILGHSSYLPSVINKNFQAFNGIQDLKWGDTITLTSDRYVLTYEVEKVYKAKAEDVTVPIAGTGPRLTLATCNSFGSKDDRYIVEAKRVKVELQS